MSSDEPDDPGAKAARTKSPKWLRITVVVVAFLVVAVIVASLVNVNAYAITPGQATPVNPLITVPKDQAQSHTGSVLLTDVELIRLRAINYLFYKLNSDDDVEPQSVISGTLTPAQYTTQGIIDMSTARQAATVNALRILGYTTLARSIGVADYAPESPDAPASHVLEVGDVITAIDGVSTLSPAALEKALSAHKPGDTVRVTFHSFGVQRSQHAPVTLGIVRTSASGDISCTPVSASSSLAKYLRAGKTVPCLGIEVAPLYSTLHPPFPISMNAEGIIGPSAGLAFTLGLIQKLDPADLTGGAKVAATGTISLDGTVGDVGGVAQKTVAVRNAGATVFFVPTPELKVAEAHAGPHLKVIAIANLDQAIAALERMGGRVVRPTAD